MCKTNCDKVLVTNRGLCEDGNLMDVLKGLEKVWTEEKNRKPVRLILREKDMDEATYEKLAKEVLKFCKKNGIRGTIHSFVDAAEKLSCSYLHLPFPLFQEKAEKIARMKAAGILQEVGVSIHRVEEACFVMEHGGDYLTAGHIFATDCKKGLAPRGIPFLKTICDSVTIPVYAIGGIGLHDEEKIQQCVNAGAAGVCIMSDYMHLGMN